MNQQPTDSRQRPVSRHTPLRWRNGGWALAVAALLVLLIAAWQIHVVLRHRGAPATGDGEHVATYGFDLTNLQVPRDPLVAAGFPRDGVPVLHDPPTMTAAAADRYNDEQRGKYLVLSDRVLGVTAGGVACAYPLRVLNYHEIANVTQGGQPLLVTWHPLSGAAVVFDRRINGTPRTFGHSGLLYNSNLVLYDEEEKSLWCQLLARPIAGPAVETGQELHPVAAQLTTWGVWRMHYPRTRVLRPDPQRTRLYKRAPYGMYYGNDLLRFPVSPLPPRSTGRYKQQCMIVRYAGTSYVFALASIRQHAGPNGTWRPAAALPVIFQTDSAATTAWAQLPDGATLLHSFWFAWYATHPQTRLQ